MDDVMDVDQWLRGFAFATLAGVRDQYGGAGSAHNAQFYLRPADQRFLFFPHDLDFFFGNPRSGAVNNADLQRLIEDPAHRRAYYGHLQDIVARSYTAESMGPWCDQLGALLPGQNFAAHCTFIGERADWVMNSASDAVNTVFPPRPFQITTGGGEDVSVAAPEIVLEGEGWVDVRGIEHDGVARLPIWLDDATWQATVVLEPRANEVTLIATDHRGRVVGSDSITATSTQGR
jgi:hypothetical protein